MDDSYVSVQVPFKKPFEMKKYYKNYEFEMELWDESVTVTRYLLL